ncbi:Glutamine-dependent NAD(+) synthetase [Nymphon striatum]|nr:Glutamine-dependent NAD(+) synthetase [Nymphon striatum]
MTDRFRVTLAQLNPTVGDIAGNAAKARDAWAQGRDAGADLVMLPEMFLVGYQTQDLILKAAFERDAMAALDPVDGGLRGWADAGDRFACLVAADMQGPWDAGPVASWYAGL